ncbi:cobalt ECF transporter T component CbiQ [Salinactinospora qingdaonensis]|uniref:Cobalt ECF transporter T component CbiQ n=1 Tax=Salinactinospora qingdaonensis TaxID=702744 RepID=A0ABP7GCE2_9ACTN
MSAGHRPLLYREGHTPLHRLPAQCKLAAACCFVLIVVATPREQFWAFAVYAGLLAGVAAVGRVPPGFVAARMLIEIPFVVFALALPFLSTGEQTVEVLGVSLVVNGLLDAFALLVKGSLGVATSIVLAATTRVAELLDGLERLRLPRILVLIAAFMIRYIAVVAEEMGHMRVAMASRGFRPRTLRHLPALASLAGSLFIRTYERGERIYVAMLSRGYSGTMPATAVPATPRAWAATATLPTLALAVLAAGWMLQL